MAAEKNRMKVCTKCGNLKDKSEFYPSNINLDGLQSNCKECHLISCKNYRDRKKDKYKKWRDDNKDYVKAYREKDYKENKNSILARNKKYRNTNKEDVLLKNKVTQQRYRDELHDTYVRSLIIRNTGASIPDGLLCDMMEQKRITIQLNRLIDEKSREANTQGNNGRPNDVLS